MEEWKEGRGIIGDARGELTLTSADADLSQAILTDRNSLPLDEMVIRKMDFERFIAALTTTEERYVRYKMIEELPDRSFVHVG